MKDTYTFTEDDMITCPECGTRANIDSDDGKAVCLNKVCEFAFSYEVENEELKRLCAKASELMDQWKAVQAEIRKLDPMFYGIADLWYAEDVQSRDDDGELSPAECAQVLDDMVNTTDACHGINWDAIDCEVEIFKAEREVTKDSCGHCGGEFGNDPDEVYCTLIEDTREVVDICKECFSNNNTELYQGKNTEPTWVIRGGKKTKMIVMRGGELK